MTWDDIVHHVEVKNPQHTNNAAVLSAFLAIYKLQLVVTTDESICCFIFESIRFTYKATVHVVCMCDCFLTMAP